MGLIAFLKNKFGKKKEEDPPFENKLEAEEPSKESEPDASSEPSPVEAPTPKAENETILDEKTSDKEALGEEAFDKTKLEETLASVFKIEEEAPSKLVKKERKEEDKETGKGQRKEDKKEKKKKSEQDGKSLEKYEKGMAKSRHNFASKLALLSKRYAKTNSEYFEELEQILIESDVGVELSIHLIEDLLDWSIKEKITDPETINSQLIDNMFVDYATKGESIENEITFVPGRPTVLLVVGVNGVGKTTSIAKLAHRYMEKGKKVLLVAGDTFRAGATAQLSIWAERLGCPIVTGKENGDPASVAYDGCQYAKAHGIDLMIVDTAGRQQTKQNLMQELAKINRVLGREIEGAPHESFLILDGTTGQNGVLQAKAFKEVTTLSGIVITKMDGTSKGGIILSIRDELGIPVRFIGLGETMDDLQEFDLEKYLYGLLLGGEYDE